MGSPHRYEGIEPNSRLSLLSLLLPHNPILCQYHFPPLHWIGRRVIPILASILANAWRSPNLLSCLSPTSEVRVNGYRNSTVHCLTPTAAGFPWKIWTGITYRLPPQFLIPVQTSMLTSKNSSLPLVKRSRCMEFPQKTKGILLKDLFTLSWPDFDNFPLFLY